MHTYIQCLPRMTEGGGSERAGIGEIGKIGGIGEIGEIGEAEALAQAEAARAQVLRSIGAMQSLLVRLDEQVLQLRTAVAEREATRSRNRETIDKLDAVITLNLRGTCFLVDRDVLARHEHSYFHALLCAACPPLREGAYFIDRPFEGFERIIDFLTSGELSLTALGRYEWECVRSNLAYFGMSVSAQELRLEESEELPFMLCPLVQLEDGSLCGATRASAACSTVQAWDLHSKTLLRELESEMHADEVVVHLRDGRLGCATASQSLLLRHARSFAPEMELDGHSERVTAMLALSDGRLCSASSDIKVWNVSSGEMEVRLTGHLSEVTCLAQLGKAADRICSSSFDGTLRLWSLASRQCELTIAADGGWLWSVCVLADGRLAGSSSTNKVRLWSAASGESEGQLLGHSAPVFAVVQLRSGLICTGSADCTIRVWDPVALACALVLDTGGQAVKTLLALHDGRLLSSDEGRSLRIWTV